MGGPNAVNAAGSVSLSQWPPAARPRGKCAAAAGCSRMKKSRDDPAASGCGEGAAFNAIEAFAAACAGFAAKRPLPALRFPRCAPPTLPPTHTRARAHTRARTSHTRTHVPQTRTTARPRSGRAPRSETTEAASHQGPSRGFGRVNVRNKTSKGAAVPRGARAGGRFAVRVRRATLARVRQRGMESLRCGRKDEFESCINERANCSGARWRPRP